MKRLLYILSLAVLAFACTPELKETGLDSADLEGKVLIDFSVKIPDVGPATKAMTETPALKNLMVAVFDKEGYLVESAFALGNTVLATENGTKCLYQVALTQSKERRIIHFIGNAPKNLRFGTEETVLSYVKSELGSENEDLYWYRREVPSISGTNQTLDPVYQATPDTKAAFDNIPLIRNFARISLENAATTNFELESWTVVNTYKTGTCAAYNTSNGSFAEYFNYVDSQDATLQQLGIKELSTPKTLATLLGENYKGNVPANVEKISVEEAKSKLSSSQYYYAYERDVTTDPAYIIACGTYKGDGNNNKCYYKIGLYDNDGKSFPLLRNFEYKLTITKVERAGYGSFEEASTSTGSGNISTAQETLSLVYISDGVASLSVDYTEKMIVEVPKEGHVDLGFKFISDVSKGTEGSLSNVKVVVNKPEGTAGVAIAKVNGTAVAAGDEIKPNDWTLEITPVTPTSVSKKQSLTIYADYTKAGQTVTIQRTVTYIVWEKQSLIVECVPNEIPRERGSDMNLHVTLPGGLSSSMFPLDLKIEAANLSITPNNEKDHMPVQTGKSIINSSKSAFYFIKTVQWAEYLASKLVTCYFKSNKDQSASWVYVANDYFNTANDEFTTYVASHFDPLEFSDDHVPCVEDFPVDFSFTMDGKLDQEVKVYLDGLQPHEDDPNRLVPVVVNGAVDHYVFTPKSANVTLKLQTTDANTPLYVGLESYHYAPNHETARRDWSQFTGEYYSIEDNKVVTSLGTAAGQVIYKFEIPTYIKGMDITATFEGFTPDPSNKSNNKWIEKTNGVWQYTPSEDETEVSIILNYSDLPSSVNQKDYSITLNADGYEEYVSEIQQRDVITIPAGNLRTSTDIRKYTPLYIYSTNPGTNTNLTALASINAITRGGTIGNRVYYNTNAVQISGVSPDDTLYIRYSYSQYGTTRYYVASFKLSDAVNGQVTLNFTRVYN